jgi:hypothetical protein
VWVAAVMAAEGPLVRQAGGDHQHAGSSSPHSYVGPRAPVGLSAKGHPQRKAPWVIALMAAGVTDPFKSPETGPSGLANNSFPASENPVKRQTNSQQTSVDAPCRNKLGGNLTPAQKAQHHIRELKCVQCLRSQAVTDFPNPTNGGFDIGPTSAINSPAFQTAQKACQSFGHSMTGNSYGN